MRDASQVEHALEQYGDMVRRICFLHLKHQSDAEDAFQEVFLRYMLHHGDFASEEHQKAWLARVSLHRCRDSFRSAFRRRVTSLEDVDPAQLAVLNPQYGELYDAVLSLPQKLKGVVYLHYYEGYSAVEIARILQKNENTVYTWLARARTQLRERLGGEEQ